MNLTPSPQMCRWRAQHHPQRRAWLRHRLLQRWRSCLQPTPTAATVGLFPALASSFCVFTSFQPVNQKVVPFSHPDITAVPSTVSAMFASTQVCLSFARLVWVATPPILFSLSDKQTLRKQTGRPRANVCCELFVYLRPGTATHA